MSVYSSTGVHLECFEPLAVGTQRLFPLSDEISSFRHTLLADGGYWSASLSLQGSPALIEDWIQSGLGRRILVYNRGGIVIGEYFVNALSAAIGTRGVKLGPLLNSPNRVRVYYAPKDTSITPPAVGATTVSTTINNTTMQTQYGIIERNLSGGAMSAAEITLFANTFLTEYAMPVSSEEIHLSTSSLPTVSLDCLGYIHWMNAYTYNNTTAGTVNLKARIEALLAANPNAGMFSTDYSQIAVNASTIDQYTNENKPAYALLKEAVVHGDASYNRYTFGMYANRIGVYAAIPTAQEYMHEITGGSVDVTGYRGRAMIDPWDILPGQWAFDPDFLVGRIQPATATRLDPRNVFLESVTYTAPYDLALNGSRIATMNLNQIMLAMGISGLGGN